MSREIEQLADQQRRITEMQEYIPGLVVQARYAGASWRAIGAALGISRQGAQQRYSPLIDPALAGPDDEEPATDPMF
jgi:hypothetical protein